MSDTGPVHGDARTEPRDVNVRGILYVAAGLVVMGLIVHVAAWWVFDSMKAADRAGKPSEFPLAAKERGRLPEGPRLEQIEREQGKEGPLYAEEQRRLETYGWVDQKKEILRIPIDRAMKVMVEQDRLPARRAEPGR
jgi:hypothetical protein